MSQAFDVLVLGGGVAGVSAALAAAAGGRRVGLVRAGAGVTGLAAGGWAGPLPAGLAGALAGAGLEHLPTAGPLPHPTGRLDAYAAAPTTHTAVELGDGALICGIAGLPGFHAATLARLWGTAAGAAPRPATLAAGPMPPGGWSPAALAGTLERDARPLADALARAVREAGADRAIVPAVLGLERAAAVRAALMDAAGVPVGEALGVPPSLPGWRLGRALDEALAAARVEVVHGRIVGRDATARRVAAVLVAAARPGDGAEPLRLQAGSFVLATGKFLAGGIRAAEAFEEPALGCPVHVEHLEQVFEIPDRLALTHPERRADQPLLRAGVRTDVAGRPVDRRGDVVYENVRVAGTVRSGRDSAAPGLGHAAADGWAAGQRAAESP